MSLELKFLITLSKNIIELKKFIEGPLVHKILSDISESELRAASNAINDINISSDKKAAANRAITHLESAYELFRQQRIELAKNFVKSSRVRFKSAMTNIEDFKNICAKESYICCLTALMLHHYIKDNDEIINQKLIQAEESIHYVYDMTRLSVFFYSYALKKLPEALENENLREQIILSNQKVQDAIDNREYLNPYTLKGIFLFSYVIISLVFNPLNWAGFIILFPKILFKKNYKFFTKDDSWNIDKIEEIWELRRNLTGEKFFNSYLENNLPSIK